MLKDQKFYAVEMIVGTNVNAQCIRSLKNSHRIFESCGSFLFCINNE